MTRELRHAYLTLWATTAIGATLAIAGVHMIAAPAPHDALPATPGTAAELLAHNAPIALWPLALIAVGWPRLPGARRAGHALVAGQLVAHGLLVGNALGQHPGLWRYLPHLPLEWLALATPAGAWLAARRDTPAQLQWLGHVGVGVLAVLTLAAIVETYLVPLPGTTALTTGTTATAELVTDDSQHLAVTTAAARWPVSIRLKHRRPAGVSCNPAAQGFPAAPKAAGGSAARHGRPTSAPRQTGQHPAGPQPPGGITCRRSTSTASS